MCYNLLGLACKQGALYLTIPCDKVQDVVVNGILAGFEYIENRYIQVYCDAAVAHLVVVTFGIVGVIVGVIAVEVGLMKILVTSRKSSLVAPAVSSGSRARFWPPCLRACVPASSPGCVLTMNSCTLCIQRTAFFM